MGTIKGLSVEEETFIMNKDEVKQIRVSVYPSFSSCNLLFNSDDEMVATVDYFGVVHALSEGETIIRVNDSGNESHSVSVTVKVK